MRAPQEPCVTLLCLRESFAYNFEKMLSGSFCKILDNLSTVQQIFIQKAEQKENRVDSMK